MHTRVAVLLAAALIAAAPWCAHGLELERAGHVSGDYVRHAALVGDLAVRATQDEMGAGKLLLHDRSDPTRPRLVKAFSLGHFAYSMAASSSLVVTGGSGLRLIGIRNPEAPVDSGLALVWDWCSRLHVTDVSNPAAPTQVGLWEYDGSVDDLALFGRVAYVVSGSELRLLDLSDPASPQEHGPYWFDRTAARVVLDKLGAAAYVQLTEPPGIAKLNLEEPLGPLLVDFLSLEWSPRGISL
mgnify:FL=1